MCNTHGFSIYMETNCRKHLGKDLPFLLFSEPIRYQRGHIQGRSLWDSKCFLYLKPSNLRISNNLSLKFQRYDSVSKKKTSALRNIVRQNKWIFLCFRNIDMNRVSHFSASIPGPSQLAKEVWKVRAKLKGTLIFKLILFIS